MRTKKEMIGKMTYEELLRRVKTGELSLTWKEYKEVFHLIPDPFLGLETNWQRLEVTLKGLNAIFTLEDPREKGIPEDAIINYDSIKGKCVPEKGDISKLG